MARTKKKPTGVTVGREPVSTLRIIGGDWRSRRVPIADRPGLRPTPDRVRETVFNWLAPRLPGAACADLFAGTGALGIEALSRGAASTVFIESDGEATKAIDAALATLGAGERARVARGDLEAARPAHEPACRCAAPAHFKAEGCPLLLKTTGWSKQQKLNFGKECGVVWPCAKEGEDLGEPDKVANPGPREAFVDSSQSGPISTDGEIMR